MRHVPETFEDLAYQIFNTLPKAPVIHYVTDTYKENSIKQMKRNKRGSSSPSPHLLSANSSKTKLPKDYKSFLMNAGNKRQLIGFLPTEWQKSKYAQQLHRRQLFFVCETECTLLESKDGLTVISSNVTELCSSQEEADTRIILHCMFAAKTMSAETSIVVRSPDIDVFVLLVYYSNEVRKPLIFDTGTSSNRRLPGN